MTPQQEAIGGVIAHHLPVPNRWRQAFDCNCGWRGSQSTSWTDHLARQIDAVLLARVT